MIVVVIVLVIVGACFAPVKAVQSPDTVSHFSNLKKPRKQDLVRQIVRLKAKTHPDKPLQINNEKREPGSVRVSCRRCHCHCYC